METTETKATESEFGKGFLYPLCLFAQHLSYRDSQMPFDFTHRMIFSASTDHLFELEIPESLKGGEICRLVNDLLQFCDERRRQIHNDLSVIEMKNEINQVKELLSQIMRTIDEEVFKVQTIEATWP